MTPDEAVAYHRTFLLFDPSTHLCKVGCHGTKGSGQQVLVDAPTLGSDKKTPFQTADLRSVDPGTDLRRRGLESPNTFQQFAAMQWKGQSVKQITIVPKMAQDFRAHATAWELAWSSLAGKGPRKFMPIVDGNYTVLGHLGRVGEGSLIVPEDTPGALESLAEILQSHPEVPVLVLESPAATVPEGWRMIRNGRYWYWHTVVVGIDGEVVERTLSEGTSHGTAVATDGPLDYLSLAAIAGKMVGKIGIGVLHGLGRSLSRVGGRLVAKSMAKKAAKKAIAALPFVKGHQAAMGIPAKHFDAIAAAAKETDMILIFRSNKLVAAPLIEKGAPGKPFFFKFKSDPQTGVLTATADDLALVYQHGYYTVVNANTAQRVVMKGGKEVVETIPLKNPFWTVKPGQVIHPTQHKPVVGDYDMLGAAPMKSKGSNVALVPDDPKGNWTGPYVEKAAKAVNRRLDQPRVLHGAQDQSKMGLSDDAAYAVYPDGRVVMMSGRADQEKFYEMIGRKTGAGSYPRPQGPAGEFKGPRLVE